MSSMANQWKLLERLRLSVDKMRWRANDRNTREL